MVQGGRTEKEKKNKTNYLQFQREFEFTSNLRRTQDMF